MNDNFLIPNQSSLFNIKSIYNAFIENLSDGGFENIIINPEMNQLTQDSTPETKQAGWDFSGTNPIGVHYLGDGDYIRQDIRPKLRSQEIYTVILDIRIWEPVRFGIEGQLIAPHVYAPRITDINYSDPIDYQQNLIKVLEPQFDNFNQPIRFQTSFNFKYDYINYSSYTPALLSFMKDISAQNDTRIDFYNISVVKGLFGVNLTKRQGFFTDYVQYNNNDGGFYEASMDDGETYHRILTTRDEDVDEFVDILVTKDIIYTKNDCDLMFLRKDIPDAAERLITFLEGWRAEEDVNIAEAANLVLDGGQIFVNNSQQFATGAPSKWFELTVKRGNQDDVGLRYNETIDRWQFTHDGIDWKVMGSGDGGTGTGTGSSELEYYAEILNRTPYKWGYYDLFDEVDQGDSVITQNLNYDGDDTLYKVQEFPTGPWYVTTKNIWSLEHAGNTYGFFVHALTNQHANAGLNISYSLIGSGGGDPLLPTDPAWIPITMNEIISPTAQIDEMYLKFEFIDDTIKFHSFGVFYGVWDYSASTYTRLREYYTSTGTNQTILVPNGGEYSVGKKALELYLNRVRQILGTDYNEVDSTHVQMLVPVNAGDVVEFYEKFGYADFSEDNTITLNAHMADISIHNNIGLGKDQVWQDLTSSRAINTVYTNTTNAPVCVKIDPVITEAGTLVLEVSNDNVTFITMPDFNTIVPATHYYKLTDTSATTPATIDLWVELS